MDFRSSCLIAPSFSPSKFCQIIKNKTFIFLSVELSIMFLLGSKTRYYIALSRLNEFHQLGALLLILPLLQLNVLNET